MIHQYIVAMPDGSEWAVPLRVIAESYKRENQSETKVRLLVKTLQGWLKSGKL